MIHLETPLTLTKIRKLRVGDEVLINGIIYTARDQAHIKKLPFPLKGQIIYYCGPAPTPPGKIIGSCGPTTSSRMDRFTPLLLKKGLKGMLGKGRRSEEVIRAIKKYKAIYLITFGGCGALLSTFVRRKELVAYPELGAEAVYRLDVENFPAIVAVDCYGKDIWSKNARKSTR